MNASHGGGPKWISGEKFRFRRFRDKSPPLETLEAEPRRSDSWVTNRGFGWFHNVSYQKESEKDFRWLNILRHDMGVSENVVYPIVPNGFADHYPVFKWL